MTPCVGITGASFCAELDSAETGATGATGGGTITIAGVTRFGLGGVSLGFVEKSGGVMSEPFRVLRESLDCSSRVHDVACARGSAAWAS
jgi:hypothetical protein